MNKLTDKNKSSQQKELKIVFEDDTLLAIDKPAGMVVNRAETTRGEETVQDWIEKKLAKDTSDGVRKHSSEVEEFFKRSGIVHRLDQETSGLLLVAKTPEAFLNLQSQFKNRQVKKKYLALVHGKVVPEEGEIKAPVGRLPWNRKRFGVVPGGREAVTRYKVVRRAEVGTKIFCGTKPARQEGKMPFRSSKILCLPARQEDFSLLELSPLTGRTHQIRVHLKYLGHPIVGDLFYAGRKQALEDRKSCPRVFLHASFISFKHPKTGDWLEFNSPLPNELESILTNTHVRLK